MERKKIISPTRTFVFAGLRSAVPEISGVIIFENPLGGFASVAG
jgi:hypothetical protein